MSLVLDAGAAVDALVPTRLHLPALRAIDGEDLCAPVIIDLEVVSALARLERAGKLSATEASQAVADWHALAVDRIPAEPLMSDVWDLRRSARISDAFYLAAAHALRIPLVTSDARLSRSAVPGVTVTLLG